MTQFCSSKQVQVTAVSFEGLVMLYRIRFWALVFCLFKVGCLPLIILWHHRASCSINLSAYLVEDG